MKTPLAMLMALLSAAPALAIDITSTLQSQLDWVTTPEGVAFAALHGDRFSESYMAMVELPGGLVSPAHLKSADMFGLMVSGTMTHVPMGQNPSSGKRLGPGAYYHIPAGMAHVSSCLSECPCVTFLYQPGAFDFLPAGQ